MDTLIIPEVNVLPSLTVDPRGDCPSKPTIIQLLGLWQHSRWRPRARCVRGREIPICLWQGQNTGQTPTGWASGLSSGLSLPQAGQGQEGGPGCICVLRDRSKEPQPTLSSVSSWALSEKPRRLEKRGTFSNKRPRRCVPMPSKTLNPIHPTEHLRASVKESTISRKHHSAL